MLGIDCAKAIIISPYHSTSLVPRPLPDFILQLCELNLGVAWERGYHSTSLNVTHRVDSHSTILFTIFFFVCFGIFWYFFLFFVCLFVCFSKWS